MKKFLSLLLCVCLMIGVLVGCQTQTTASADSTSEASYFGQVKAIDGSTLTISLATDPHGNGTAPSGKPAGDTSTGDSSSGNTPPSKPTGDKPADDSSSGNNTSNTNSTGGTPPSMPSLTLTGEEKTVTISDSTKITLDKMGKSSAATTADITVGSIVTVTMNDTAVASISIRSFGGPQGSSNQGGASGDMAGSSSGSVSLSGVYAVNGASESSDGQTYEATKADESAVLVSNGGKLTLTDSTLKKSGNSSSVDESNFYGLNAIFAVTKGSSASISNTVLTSDSEGSNGIFATGENATINVDNVKISTTGNSSRGLDATFGGKIIAKNVNIATTGAHCAPLATDRGEGTITVTNGTLNASGDGSPCIYSTGNISVTNVTGTATGSQLAVVEGKNSISIRKSTLTGAGLNGVMLYQSMSGDAAKGTAKFNVENSTLKTTSTGPMFYVTNTDASATLKNTKLSFSSGVLANVAGNNTNNWGTPGSNGGNFTLKGISQTLKGKITVDEISTVKLELTKKSIFTGSINTENTGKSVTVSLDRTSTWNVQEDSYVNALTDGLKSCKNIQSNGHTVYYDASNSANAWLSGKTITLPGGGTLTPAK